MTLVGIVSQTLLTTRNHSELVLAYEVLRCTTAVRNLIREQQTQQIYSLIQTGKDDAMITMNESLKALCEQGLIAEEMALEKSPRPKELARMLQAGALLAIP